jgi:hypothetical protein
MTTVWWCARTQQVIHFDDFNTPDCGPRMQCTGGRRANLPCGWHVLVPVPENDEIPPRTEVHGGK